MMIGPPVCDQSWDFDGRHKYARQNAEAVFQRLQRACKLRWSPYINLRLMHNNEPPSPVSLIAPCRKPLLILRHYKHGKVPPLPKRLKTLPKKKASK